MDESRPSINPMSRLAAAAAAAIVAAGLVTATGTTDIAASRPASMIQQHTLAIDLTAAAIHTDTDNTTPHSTAAETTQSNIVVKIEGAALMIGYTAALIALTPVWYAAFPVTLPASIAIALLFDAGLHLVGSGFQQPGAAFLLGVAGWAVGPLYVVGETVKTVGRFLNSLVNPSPSPATASSSVARSVRRDRETGSGVAVSGRNVNAHPNTARAPQAQKAAKTISKAMTKKGTAGSARRTSREGDS